MSGLEGLFVSPWYWLVGGLVVAGLEIVVAGVFLLWIGLGAMMVGILLLLLPGMPFALQLLLFAVTMLSSVALGFFVQRRGGASVGAGSGKAVRSARTVSCIAPRWTGMCGALATRPPSPSKTAQE